MTRSWMFRALASRFVVLSGLLSVGMLASGCSTGRVRDETVSDPENEIAELQRQWAVAPTECSPDAPIDSVPCKPLLRKRAESVAFQHPQNLSAQMFVSVLAYEAGDPVDAQRHLDDLLAVAPAHAEAVCLRARIAMEEGNAAFARRLLEDRIAIRPDHSGMRETLAAALYLGGDLAGARNALAEAERLGAPRWRLAYSRGLVAEAAGETPAAIGFYQTALSHRPGWQSPRLRLRGLGAPEFVPVVIVPPAAPPPAAPPAGTAIGVTVTPSTVPSPSPAATPAATPAAASKPATSAASKTATPPVAKSATPPATVKTPTPPAANSTIPPVAPKGTAATPKPTK